jgi:hypothetical protein
MEIIRRQCGSAGVASAAAGLPSSCIDLMPSALRQFTSETEESVNTGMLGPAVSDSNVSDRFRSGWAVSMERNANLVAEELQLLVLHIWPSPQILNQYTCWTAATPSASFGWGCRGAERPESYCTSTIIGCARPVETDKTGRSLRWRIGHVIDRCTNTSPRPYCQMST